MSCVSLLSWVTKNGNDLTGRREQSLHTGSCHGETFLQLPSPQFTEPAATQSLPSYSMSLNAFHVCHTSAAFCRHLAKHRTWQVNSRLTTLAIFLLVQTLQHMHTLGECIKTIAPLFHTALTQRTPSPRKVESSSMLTYSLTSAVLERPRPCLHLQDRCTRNNVRNSSGRSTRYFVRYAPQSYIEMRNHRSASELLRKNVHYYILSTIA